MDNNSVVIIGTDLQCKSILHLFGPGTYIFENYTLKPSYCENKCESYYLYKDIKDAFMLGRHINKTVVLTIQSPKDITPILRVNTDTLIIFKNTDVDDRKNIHHSYSLYTILSFDLFDKTMDTLNDDNYLLLDNIKSEFSVKKTQKKA